MLEIILFLVVIILEIIVIIFGSIFFMTVMAYGYWGLSIGMAPVLWILMIIGAAIGLVCAIKNAIKAIRSMKGKE